MNSQHHSYAHAMCTDHAAIGGCLGVYNGACTFANPWILCPVFSAVRKDSAT